MVCGSKHKYGGQTCILKKGHDGPCRCKAEKGKGTITYSEWRSLPDGTFKCHIGYNTIYPPNLSHELDE